MSRAAARVLVRVRAGSRAVLAAVRYAGYSLAPVRAASTVEAHRFNSRDEFEAFVGSTEFAPRWLLERHLAQRHQHERTFRVPGFCVACRRGMDFVATFANAWESPEGLRVPNWREHLVCPRCCLSGRQRRVVELVARAVAGKPDTAPVVYLMEALSPLHHWCARRLAGTTVIGSEYFGPDGATVGAARGVRHEDAEQLTFADASVDVVVSCDVLEHVAEPRRAFAEIARVLRPGGRAILTFPMDTHVEAHQRRAELVDGAVRHLLPPVHHGNPLSAEGALVFTDFGWDVLADLRAAGLADPHLELYWSYEAGYLGIQFCFLAGRA